MIKYKLPTLRQAYDAMREHYADKTVNRTQEVALAYETVMVCVYNRLLSESKRKKKEAV